MRGSAYLAARPMIGWLVEPPLIAVVADIAFPIGLRGHAFGRQAAPLARHDEAIGPAWRRHSHITRASYSWPARFPGNQRRAGRRVIPQVTRNDWTAFLSYLREDGRFPRC